jgi:hypothetical protein
VTASRTKSDSVFFRGTFGGVSAWTWSIRPIAKSFADPFYFDDRLVLRAPFHGECQGEESSVQVALVARGTTSRHQKSSTPSPDNALHFPIKSRAHRANRYVTGHRYGGPRLRGATPQLLRASISLCIAMLVGCTTSTSLKPLQETGPTVAELIDHVACSVAQAYFSDHKTDEETAMWRRLYDDNFVASVDLNLMLTRTESFNPSLNYINPLTATGGLIDPIIYAAKTGTMATTATYNRTLSLGLQLNATQDRNIDLAYNIDIKRLVDHYSQGVITPSLVDLQCDKEITADAEKIVRNEGTGIARVEEKRLHGNLRLDEILEDGLWGIQTSSAYNIYGTAGPTRAADVQAAILQKVPKTNEERSAAGHPPGPSSPAGGTPGNTTFSSKIDFYVTRSYGAGINWSLLQFKGPTAGGGGGGGGGGAAGGGAGGGGGGGSGQLLSYTHNTQDSLTVTFGATCRAPEQEKLLSATVRTVGNPQTTLNVLGVAQSYDSSGIVDFSFTVPPGDASPTAPSADGSTARLYMWNAKSGSLVAKSVLYSDDGTPHYGKPVHGTISWTGYMSPPSPADNLSRVSLTGAVTSETGTVVGSIFLGGTSERPQWWPDQGIEPIQGPQRLLMYVPPAIVSRLGSSPTTDYWAAIPPCDTMTSAEKQSAVDNATRQNLLLRLPQEVRGRLLQ